MLRTNPLDESAVAAIRREIARSASALEAHELPFIEGVRRLAGLRFELPGGDFDQDLLLFAAIESQADHIPNTQMRALCAESWLAQCDAETKEMEALYEEQVALACKRLYERFSGEA
jgi:hypothetical protein